MQSSVDQRKPPHYLKIGFVLAMFVASFARDAISQEIPENDKNCYLNACLFVKYDKSLEEEVAFLEETLQRHLCNRGVAVVSKPDDTSANPAPETAGTERKYCIEKQHRQDEEWWTARLKLLSANRILLLIEYKGSKNNDHLIREIPRGPDSAATAWTTALMIEEAILPYLEDTEENGPVGAGLAIIEPREVGGQKKSSSDSRRRYPELRSLGLGVAMCYLGWVTEYVDGLLAGPEAVIQGLLGERLLASLSIGWMGSGRFYDFETRTKGTISYVPIDILFGGMLISKRTVSFSLLAGVSTGFAIYQSQSAGAERQRTDVYFDPLVQGGFELSIRLFNPLAIYLNGRTAFPIRIDVMQNNGHTVYRQDWILPILAGGLQLLL